MSTLKQYLICKSDLLKFDGDLNYEKHFFKNDTYLHLPEKANNEKINAVENTVAAYLMMREENVAFAEKSHRSGDVRCACICKKTSKIRECTLAQSLIYWLF